MSSAIGPLLAALMLAATYLLGHRFVPLEKKHPRRWLSLAAGASMAYVFLDVLPELGMRHTAFLAMVGDVSYARHRLYVLALAGFIVLYALDQMVEASRAEEDGSGARPETRAPIFWVHIAGYALYGGIIGDALVLRGEEGRGALWLYLVAMMLHLVVVSSALAREHGNLYRARGRWVLAASVLGGWTLAVLAPLPEVVMSRLFAFVAGGVLMTSANEELPREKGGRFGWFVTGAAVYAALLILT